MRESAVETWRDNHPSGYFCSSVIQPFAFDLDLATHDGVFMLKQFTFGHGPIFFDDLYSTNKIDKTFNLLDKTYIHETHRKLETIPV